MKIRVLFCAGNRFFLKFLIDCGFIMRVSVRQSFMWFVVRYQHGLRQLNVVGNGKKAVAIKSFFSSVYRPDNDGW